MMKWIRFLTAFVLILASTYPKGNFTFTFMLLQVEKSTEKIHLNENFDFIRSKVNTKRFKIVANGIICYGCTSRERSACGHPFNSTAIGEVVQCPEKYDACVTVGKKIHFLNMFFLT